MKPAQPPPPSDFILCGENHNNRIKTTSRIQTNAPPLDLGWGNGWDKTPKIVADCIDAQQRGEVHDITDAPTQWTCCHRVTCATCGYTYQYDSGG